MLRIAPRSPLLQHLASSSFSFSLDAPFLCPARSPPCRRCSCFGARRDLLPFSPLTLSLRSPSLLLNRSELVVTFNAERSGWVSLPTSLGNRLFDEGTDLPVPLRVTGPSRPDGVPLYVAWAGATGQPGKLGVPSSLGRALGLRDGERVRVSQCDDDVPPAASVSVEPADPDDWEVVELNAGHLENAVLTQTGVASKAQKLPLWVHGTQVVLAVTNVSPAAPAVRLVAGTELYVAPRLRMAGSKGRAEARANGAEGAGNPGALEAPERTKCTLRVIASEWPRGPLAVSRETIKDLGLGDDDLEAAEMTAAPRAKMGRRRALEIDASVPRGHVALPRDALRDWNAAEDSHLRLLVEVTKGDRDDDAGDRKLGRQREAEQRGTAVASPIAEPVGGWLRSASDATLEVVLPILSLKGRTVLSRWGASRCGGVLLTGPAGSGKSLCAATIARTLRNRPDCRTHAVTLDCRVPLKAGVLEKTVRLGWERSGEEGRGSVRVRCHGGHRRGRVAIVVGKLWREALRGWWWVWWLCGMW